MSSNKKHYKTVTNCRVCEGNLKPILDLGEQYIINFPDGESTEEALTAPLSMYMCENKDCSLVQLAHTVDPDMLYREFWYKSGVNQTMRDELSSITTAINEKVNLKSGDIAIDIGSNDSTLLKSYSVEGLRTVGFEPATNLMEEARKDVTMVVNDYFNGKSFNANFAGEHARAITSIAMFYDLPDPNAFVGELADILADDGVWINQMNYLGTMLSKNAFDNISHEHLEYYSLSSLNFLLARHNLEVFDLELREINGGSIRAYICKKGAYKVEQSVTDLLKEEEVLKTQAPYDAFVASIDTNKKKMRDFIQAEKSEGKSFYVYGASTRGNTLLQYFGIDYKDIVAAADRNPIKWGKKMVGTNIPIKSEKDCRESNPDYFLVLPWSFRKEFYEREQDFLKKGGKLIFPLSEFEVVKYGDL